MKNGYQILSGNEAAILGALDGGAEVMFGYPITPASEILQGWIENAQKDKNLKYLQTEDETAAGFALCGAILAGIKAFTATAGPGHVLMQDPISMAENIRLPFVGIIMQRGGPSTGTVNFSQQELNLAAFGGNGEGLRIVYSASSVEEMYSLTAKAISVAWKYRFPTFVLGDGYIGKMKAKVNILRVLKPVKSKKILKEEKIPTYLRNCYSAEEELGEILDKNIYDWSNIGPKVSESEVYNIKDAKELIIAHGLVASACKMAIDELADEKKKVALFRPITVHPIDNRRLKRVLSKIKKIHIFESSKNQFSRIIKYQLYGSRVPIYEHSKPAEGFTPDEISNIIRD